MRHYTGVYRDTKDLDLFLRPEDTARAMAILDADGWSHRVAPPMAGWPRASAGDYFVDLIFSSGNGVAGVDGGWFEHAPPAAGVRPSGPPGARRRR